MTNSQRANASVAIERFHCIPHAEIDPRRRHGGSPFLHTPKPPEGVSEVC